MSDHTDQSSTTGRDDGRIFELLEQAREVFWRPMTEG
jgi:hypothetical protein